MLKSIITSLLDHSKPLYKKDKVHVDVNEREAQKNCFLGIFPKLVPPPSVHLGIEMWILAKFKNKNVNFMAKNNGHQNFT